MTSMADEFLLQTDGADDIAPGNGTVVTGTVETGTVRPGDELDIITQTKLIEVTCTGLEPEGSTIKVHEASMGQRVKVFLDGIGLYEVRSFNLCIP